jgi:hypothetical protein
MAWASTLATDLLAKRVEAIPREFLPSTGPSPRYGKAWHRRAEDGDKTLSGLPRD